MAPVATNETQAPATNGASTGPVKAAKAVAEQLFNPFYSPPESNDKDDSDYAFAKYKVRPPGFCDLRDALTPTWSLLRRSRPGRMSSGSPSRSSL